MQAAGYWSQPQVRNWFSVFVVLGTFPALACTFLRVSNKKSDTGDKFSNLAYMDKENINKK